VWKIDRNYGKLEGERSGKIVSYNFAFLNICNHENVHIELNARYECALIDFNMYNSIPNIDKKNNLFHIGDKVITIPTGSYKLNISPISFTIK